MSPRRFCFGWKSKLLAAFLDGWYALLPSSRPALKTPKKLLLSNWGSLGDVLIATSVIPTIKRHYPGCRIGFLVSDRGRAALDSCLGIDHIHTCKWQLNKKTTLGRLFQFLAFFWQRRALVHEIASESYDTFIELYPFFPNTIALSKAAKIPQRIGFDTSGGGPLLTHRAVWQKDCYLLGCYPWLLKKLGIDEQPSIQLVLSHLLPLPERAPIFFHMGSSDKEKELPVAFWKELYDLLKNEGFKVAFTGKGERQNKLIASLEPEEGENLCDQLPWNDLVCFIARAPCVITVDTVSAHIAAAAKRPLFVFYLKNPHIALWKPEGAVAFDGIPDPREVALSVIKKVEDYEIVDLHSYR